jgi:hydrogenase maturation protein HypF
MSMERRAIVVRGIVQGVGFRPFVYNLAVRLHLAGYVRNQTGSVHIEIEGEASTLDQFLEELAHHPPPLAQVEEVSWERQPLRGEADFRIETSEADATSPIFISPDVAVCAECVAEMMDPGDRRFWYPFLNCSNCGPRLTIITGAPYDRSRTTMAPFVMCPACGAEYDDPCHRRFHAQPTACPKCGPRLRVLGPTGQRIVRGDPLRRFALALRDGKIGAIKGLGGYHLTCDARNPVAVAELRKRKHRDEKPFAVMVPNLTAAETLCHIEQKERELLASPQSPIVLLRRRLPSVIAEAVAPGNPLLGVMLPYTPLHHLLFPSVANMPLVMTSGNRSDEPIAYGDDAPDQLAGIADLFLVHDRPIHVRCDDSVMRLVDGIELPLRRSRGYAPRPIELPFPCPRPLLAVGGQLKVTFALGRDRQAFLSQHMGDLDHFEAYRAFEKDIPLFEELFGLKPQVLACDMHPDYATTRHARQRAEREGKQLLTVQHHQAHMASCMAENQLNETVIGVTFDGAGYGTDGTVWGGEFLLGDYRQFRRAAHMRPVGMPGGEAAVRQPWRMALAHLVDAETTLPPLTERLLPAQTRTVTQMLQRRFNSPLTSSIGRLFDAVASLAGVRDQVSHEGQAAIELEWLAATVPSDGAYPFTIASSPEGKWPLIVDTRPMIRAIAADVIASVEQALIARRFHSSVTDMVAEVCGLIRETTGIDAVVLSGGVFLNALLATEVSVRLRGGGFRVYRHRLVPPSDGGLSLGQLAIVASLLSIVG